MDLFILPKLRRRNCRRKSETVKEILMQTYTIVLPVLLGYIVWLLKNQKKDRDANSKGTMLLLRVQMIEYHAKYTKFGNIPLILGGISIVICAIYVFATCTCGTGQDIAMAIFTAITQGILIAGLSTYVNQIVKQVNKDE